MSISKKNGWTSNDKEKFKLGEEYWCFFMDTTNKGNKLRHLNGVSLYKCTKATKRWVEFDTTTYDGRLGYWNGSTEFEHISGEEIYHAHPYMDGYGSAICHFFHTEQDAKDGHDERIKNYAKGLTVSEQNAMYSKMFGSKPNASKKEINAMAFYKNLSDTDKGHVRWLKEYGNL